MCYYSTTLPRGTYRDAKEGEDLKIISDSMHHGHHYAQAESDDKIVCIMHGSKVHIEKFELEPIHRAAMLRGYGLLHELEGKPVEARFRQVQTSYAADTIVLSSGVGVHLVYIKAGTKFYIGPKRPDVVKATGIDDPSIALDHRSDVEPTHGGLMRKLVNALTVDRT